MNDCIFCKIVGGQIPATKVYEDNDFVAFLDIHPVSYGHTLVIPKEHFDKLENTPEETVVKLYKLIRRLAPAVVAGSEAEGYNLGLNSGAVAGQIIPRRKNDGLELWGEKEYQGNMMDEIAKKIRAAIKQALN
ncbi:MAG: Histidine triad (HIT) protein [Parcubacteria group bacterium GW2011_GWD2_43_10]|nr:MAG: Histidine triad (HIT) protein [Parcubacteria group bacterium GW2011_GWD2_43_10]